MRIRVLLVQELLSAIEQVMRGETLLCSAVRDRLPGVADPLRADA